MSVSNPIPRDNRARYLTVAPGQTLFGPFDFKIYDEQDLRIVYRASVLDPWQELTGFFVTLTGAAPSTFSIEKTGLATGTLLGIQGRRLHERETDVTRGGVINSAAMEKQLDQVTVVLQELRRDSTDALDLVIQADAASQQALAAVVQGVAGVSLFKGRSGNVVPQAGDYNASQVMDAARTNDANTFTGDQTIAKANPTLTLNKLASGQVSTLRGLRNNVLRWALRLGNATPEAGANAGSDYEEVSADDAGTETVRGRIRRSDGYRWIFGNLEIGLPDLGHWLTLRRRGAASGGRIDLERGASGNALASDVRIALEGNLLQIGETGGTQRGCSIDITALAAAFGTPLASTGANVQIFTATGPGTWTKPALLTGNEFVLALVWAAGGGGLGGFGGGGGGFKWGFYRASDLNATEALSVGAGGAAASQGGNSTFKNMTAFGGAGGGGTFGGGGGGMQGAGSTANGGGPLFGAGGVPPGASVAGGGGGAGNSGGTIGGASVFGGGGGGASAGAGGASVFGGGGGSGSGAGGTSDFGGAGGTGANAGAAPGGGGGGTSAAGGRGEIRIYTFR